MAEAIDRVEASGLYGDTLNADQLYSAMERTLEQVTTKPEYKRMQLLEDIHESRD